MKNKIVAAFLLLVLTSFKPAELTWTAIGDSITYLNDHLDETGNRVTKGYLTAVSDKLPGMHYINQGHNGWTAVKIAKDIERLGLVKSDIYTILLGTNDWWAGLPLGTLQNYKDSTGLKTVCGAYRIIIDKIKKLNPAAKIILMTPLQRGDFVYIADSQNNAFGSYKAKNGQELWQFADAVIAIAAYEHLPVVDLYHKSGITVRNVVRFKRCKNLQTGAYQDKRFPAYTTSFFNSSADAYPYPPEAVNYTYDGLHPSDKGNHKIAAMLSREISKLISDTNQ